MGAGVEHPGLSRAALAAAALAALAATSAGCAPTPQAGESTGVDELVIPTPSPDPGDFVDTVDNSWFPLRSGTVFVYTAVLADGSEGVRRVRVLPDPADVAGVETTVVRSVLTGPRRTPRRTVDYYAQDRAGNVWWFGRAGRWRAGEDGAEAGLWMAAEPRLGDGYRAAGLPRRPDPVLTVADLSDPRSASAGPSASASTSGSAEGAGSAVPSLELRVEIGDDWSANRLDTYRRGTGLVQSVRADERDDLDEVVPSGGSPADR